MGAYFKLGSLNYQRLKFSILQARVLRLQILDISSLSVYLLFFPHSFFLSYCPVYAIYKICQINIGG